MKNWTKLFKEVKKIIKIDGYINRNNLKKIKEKYDVNLSLLFKKLLEEKIPFDHKKHHVLLNALGISIKNKNIQYEDFCKLGIWRNELFKNSKINVEFVCNQCKEVSKNQLRNMLKRTYMIGEPICPKCILKVVTNLKEWKKNNSDSQLISQNKPEQIELNRQIQIIRHSKEGMKEKYVQLSKDVWARPGYREKMVEIAQKKWDNPEYAEKVIRNTKRSQLTGEYKGLFYNSSFELAFILMEESKTGSLDHIKRFYGYIPYLDIKGTKRHYYPDFIINNKLINEVKGVTPWIDYNQLERKNKSANQYCKQNKMKFRIVLKEDIPNFLIKKAKTIHYQLNKNKNQ